MGARRRPPAGPLVPLWAQVFVRGELALTAEDLAWMRSRSPAMQVLMIKFPPHAIVRVPGRAALAVAGYHPAGGLHLSYGYEPRERWTWARADQAELLVCWRGLTPERVRAILDGS